MKGRSFTSWSFDMLLLKNFPTVYRTGLPHTTARCSEHKDRQVTFRTRPRLFRNGSLTIWSNGFVPGSHYVAFVGLKISFFCTLFAARSMAPSILSLQMVLPSL